DAKDGPELQVWANEFKACAAQWLEDDVALKFEYLAVPLPAPEPVTIDGETLYSARSAIDTNTVFIEYDLLISFASMPMWFVDAAVEAPNPTRATKLTGQASVLGAYAQRTN